MKKILLVCAAMVALLVSCSKDYENKIVGTWDVVSIEAKKTKDGITSESTISNEGSITFYRDGSLDSQLHGGQSLQMIGESGNEINVETRPYWDHYSINKDELILEGEQGTSVSFKIISLTSSKLIIQSPVFDGITFNESPEPPDYDEIQYTIEFKKK